ncbi:hypothetical protein [Streptomyces johnsoniae]|uniref:Uncharacterized protein n=1 Tax=Streptomyces johnsoniae TaxID=3075532 RepID=A0ABU2S8X2_9ACTN|nr:hypothetical protein [Streptomyces sp. DSM 41886]MDT0445431.1 hypothetical protein [Streptomyces sp. DSM 41886]
MNPFGVLAAAAADWDGIRARVAEDGELRLLLDEMRVAPPGSDRRVLAAESAAGALARLLPERFAEAAAGRWTGPTTEVSVLGFTATDLAALLLDGHGMAGPVLGPVRDRLLAAAAVTADELRRRGGDPAAPGLLRLPGPGGEPRWPAFQFAADGTPWPEVVEVNEVLDAVRDPWGVADWWFSPNAWLAGAVPAHVVGTGSPGLLPATARYLGEGD